MLYLQPWLRQQIGSTMARGAQRDGSAVEGTDTMVAPAAERVGAATVRASALLPGLPALFGGARVPLVLRTAGEGWCCRSPAGANSGGTPRPSQRPTAASRGPFFRRRPPGTPFLACRADSRKTPGGLRGVSRPSQGRLRASLSAAAVVARGAAAHSPFHGSEISIPASSKSRTLRVATAMSRDRAIAAIWQSATGIGRPTRRRAAAISA